MRLYYYKSKSGIRNFGDDLNPWLFDKLLPNCFSSAIDDEDILVGIGTILDDQVPKIGKKYVFSSGVGYGYSLPIIDSSWKFYCVRGPLSAHALKLDPKKAIVDGAMLITKVYETVCKIEWNFSFMPHVMMAEENFEQVHKLCEELNINYIDPRLPIEEVLVMIHNSRRLITEAMHGAIIAEAFRVPWIPVASNEKILSFKWRDWCYSIGIDYKPIFIHPLWRLKESASAFDKTKNYIKYKLLRNQIKNIVAKETSLSQAKDQRIKELINDLENQLQEVQWQCGCKET